MSENSNKVELIQYGYISYDEDITIADIENGDNVIFNSVAAFRSAICSNAVDIITHKSKTILKVSGGILVWRLLF